MSPTLSRVEPASSALRDLYAPVAEELRQVDELMRNALRSEHSYIDELVRYGCMLGGKRLRPALVLLCGKALGGTVSAHTTMAAVMELVHTASLIHDDILDDAATRRHLATVNSRWDNKASVLLGDYLFTHAFCLAAGIGSVWACQEIARAINLVCEGELRQKGSRGDYHLNETTYLEIISAKTATLYACSCALGAHFARGSTEQIKQLSLYGQDLGIAFQIVDDVLDLAGDEAAVGKSLGTDLEQQKLTLPLIHLLSVAEPAQRREVLDILQCAGNHRRQTLTPYLERYDAFSYSYTVARQYIQSATRRLDRMPPSVAMQQLHAITEFVVSRSV